MKSCEQAGLSRPAQRLVQRVCVICGQFESIAVTRAPAAPAWGGFVGAPFGTIPRICRGERRGTDLSRPIPGLQCRVCPNLLLQRPPSAVIAESLDPDAKRRCHVRIRHLDTGSRELPLPFCSFLGTGRNAFLWRGDAWAEPGFALAGQAGRYHCRYHSFEGSPSNGSDGKPRPRNLP